MQITIKHLFQLISLVFFSFFQLNAVAQKAQPVTLTLGPTFGGVVKPGVPYSLSYGIKGFSTGAAGFTVMRQSIVTAEGNCKIIGSTTNGSFNINTTGAGTCRTSVSVNAPDGLGNIIKGSVQYTFQIPKAEQSFSEYGTKLPSSVVVGEKGEYSVTSGYNPSSNAPMPIITSTTPEICTVHIFRASGMSVLTTSYEFKARSTGTCSISYSIPESDDYQSFSTVKTVTVGGGKTMPTLSLCSTPDIVVGSTGLACFTTDAPAGVAVSSLDTQICTVNERTVTGVKEGICKVRIVTNPTDRADSSVAEQRINVIAAVGKASQEISFGSTSPMVIGSTVDLTVSGGGSGNPVILASQSPTVCSINDLTVSAVDVGQCLISANQAGNDNFNSAVEVILKLQVTGLSGKADQSIAFSPDETLDVGRTVNLFAVSGGSNNPVVFASNTSETCSVTGTTLTGLSPGVCIVTADQDGNEQFNSAPQVSKAIRIVAPGKLPQAISVLEVSPLAVGESASINAVGGLSGQPVVLESRTPTVCALQGTTVTAMAAGVCTLIATQDGTDAYNAAPTAQVDIRITQTFNPFSATISSAGAIEEQTISASFSASSDDIGLVGSQFVGATLGGVVVLLDGVNRIDGRPNWVSFNGVDGLAAFSSGVLPASQEVILVENANLSSLSGATLFFGYGIGADLRTAYGNMISRKTIVEGYEIR